MSFSPFPGPVAPQNNPTPEPQWFQPSAFPITAIAFGTTTTITTSTAFGVSNNYVVGQLVRLNIPFYFGSRKLDGQLAYVVAIPGADQVTLDINTSLGYDPFIPTPSFAPQPAQTIAVGDVNTGGDNAQGRRNNPTTINGTFINISPSAGG